MVYYTGNAADDAAVSACRIICGYARTLGGGCDQPLERPQKFVLTLFGVAQFLWYLLSDCQNSSDRAERCVTVCRMICLTDVLK